MIRLALYRIYLLIAFLSLSVAGFAQGTYQAKYWNYDNGLPTLANFSPIFQSDEGYLWSITNNGVVRFDGQNFLLFNQKSSSLPANSMSTLFEDSKNRFWYGIEANGFGTLFGDTTLQFSGPGFVNHYAEIPEGILWIGTDGSGLWKMNLETDSLEPKSVFLNELGRTIYDFHKTDTKSMFVGSNNGLFSIVKDSLIHYSQTTGHSVYSVWSDAGTIWYGIEQGLYEMENGTSKPVHFSPPPSDSLISHIVNHPEEGLLALTNQSLYALRGGILFPVYETEDRFLTSLAIDHEGGIWMGTESSGLIQLIPTMIEAFSSSDGLISQAATVMTQDQDGTIYTGTTNGLSIVHSSTDIENRFEGSVISSLLADRRDRVWVGLRGEGLRLFENNTIRSFTTENGLPSNTIWTLLEDDRGRILAGTKAGVAFYSDDQGWYRTINSKGDLLHDDVRIIRQASSGAIWIGTSYGLHKLANDSLQVFDTNDGFESAVILDIAETDTGTLWIGTAGAGMYRFKDSQIQQVPVSLTGSDVARIIHAGDNLWVSGNGVTIINFARLNAYLDEEGNMPDVLNFNLNNGLPGEIFGTIQPSGWQMQNGDLWFPTSGGAAIFPSDIKSLQLPPPPITTNYAIIGSDTLKNPERLEIPHSRDRIDISYTGFSFANPEAVSYSYRMKGFDQQWNRVGNRRTAIYTNIPPGDYQFEVKAQIEKGSFSTEVASIPVTVIPAFYETIWFRAAVVIGILLILWGGYTYRINTLKHLERLRVRIANDLHDEIGSNLGSIVLRSRMLSQSDALTGKQQQHLTEIGRISRQTAVSMRDIIWLINPDKDQMDDLQYKLKQIAGQLLVDISFEFNVRGNGHQQGIPLKVRWNTVFIYKEILHNILKHANAASVEIDFASHQKELTLLVKDDGKGFHKNGLTNDGIGLKSIQQRVDDINARLQIDSSPGKGTSVDITIPIT